MVKQRRAFESELDNLNAVADVRHIDRFGRQVEWPKPKNPLERTFDAYREVMLG